MIGGEVRAEAHFALAWARCTFSVIGGAGRRFSTSDQRVALRLRQGWPVGALAASSSGRTCAADPTAATSLQVLLALRPCVVPVPSGLFHDGHVPVDRPYVRAGYAPAVVSSIGNIGLLDNPILNARADDRGSAIASGALVRALFLLLWDEW